MTIDFSQNLEGMVYDGQECSNTASSGIQHYSNIHYAATWLKNVFIPESGIRIASLADVYHQLVVANKYPEKSELRKATIAPLLNPDIYVSGTMAHYVRNPVTFEDLIVTHSGDTELGNPIQIKPTGNSVFTKLTMPEESDEIDYFNAIFGTNDTHERIYQRFGSIGCQDVVAEMDCIDDRGRHPERRLYFRIIEHNKRRREFRIFDTKQEITGNAFGVRK